MQRISNETAPEMEQRQAYCNHEDKPTLHGTSVSVHELLPIKAHLNMRGRLIHHHNN